MTAAPFLAWAIAGSSEVFLSELIHIENRDDFIVPSYDDSKVAVTLWQPYYSKNKGAWVPGSRFGKIALFNNWVEFASIFDKKEAQQVETKGEAWSLSPGIPTYGSGRSNRNVHHMSRAVAIDVDTGGHEALERSAKVLLDRDVSCLAHTTHSHGAPGKGERFRIWLEMARETPVEEWSRFWQALVTMITGDASGKIAADKSCVDVSRVYYGPSFPAAREHLYESFAHAGRALTHEEVYDAVGLAPMGVSSGEQTDEQRAKTVAFARSLSKGAKTSFSKNDLVELAKDRKLEPTQKAALRNAAKGERICVVQGEKRSSIASRGISKGGALQDDEIDNFLRDLMWSIAVRRTDADPDQVEAAFAQSVSVLIDDDRVAGNTSYSPDVLRTKFESGVEKVQHDKLERAKRLGIPTVEELKAEKGDLDNLPQKVFLGGKGQVVYKLAFTADGPKVVPIGNFSIIPTKKLVDTENENRMQTVTYEVKIMHGGKRYEVLLPMRVLGSARSFLSWLQVPGATWDGTDADTVHLRHAMEAYVAENSIPTHPVTHCVGMHYQFDRPVLVTPHGSYVWDGGYEVKPYTEPGTPVYYHDTDRSDHADKPNSLLIQDIVGREVDVDLEKVRIFTEKITEMNTMETVAPTVGWFAAVPLKPLLHEMGYRFPFLTVVGERGVGKTVMIEQFMRAMGGSMVAITSMPAYSLAEAMSGNTSFPFMGDEFRDQAETQRDKSRIDQMRNILRSNYDGKNFYRSGMAKLMARAPAGIIGEQPSFGSGHAKDHATAQRTLVVRPRKAAISPAHPDFHKHRAAHDALEAMDLKESGFWALYQCYVGTRWKPEAVRAMMAECEEKVIAYFKACHMPADHRTRKNVAVDLFGNVVWYDWRAFLGLAPTYLPTVADVASATIEELTAGNSSDTYDDPIAHFVEALSLMLAKENSLGNMGINKFWHKEGDTLYLHVSGALEYFKTNRGDRSLISGSREVWYYAESSVLCLDGAKGKQHRKRIANSGINGSVRCLQLSIPLMETAQIELSERFLQDEADEGATFA